VEGPGKWSAPGPVLALGGPDSAECLLVLADGGGGRGKCAIPCKKGAELSGRGNMCGGDMSM